jgi:hypothetical protein
MSSWLGRKSSQLGVDFVAKPINRRAHLCGATEEPDSFLVNHQKPRMQGTASPRQASSPPSLSPLAPGWSTRSCPIQWLGHYLELTLCSRLHFAFLATVRPALDPVGHRVPWTKPTCLSTPQRPHMYKPFALVLHLYHANEAQLAPTILDQELVHTTLSTTHHECIDNTPLKQHGKHT